MNTEHYVVYCPSLGYRVDLDTGKQFRGWNAELEARRFVRQLRLVGLLAWYEMARES